MTSQTTGASATRSLAYARLVSSSSANVSLASYVVVGLYETLKHEWIASEQQRLGRELTADEIEAHGTLLTPAMTRNLDQAANDALKVYAAEAVQKETPNAIKAHLEKGSFWTDVGAGVVAAFVWTSILVIIGFIVALASPDLFDWIEKIHKLVHPGG